MSNRFSYVKYDEDAVNQQGDFKSEFQSLELMVDELEDGRAKALVYTKLEEAYMWIGKAIRDSQIKRTGQVDEQPERNNE